MSIKRSIKKNIQRISYENCIENHLFYNKENKVYAIFSIILSVFLTTDITALFILTLNNGKKYELKFYICLIMLFSFCFILSLYMFILAIKLLRKKLLLMVADGNIIIKGVFIKKEMKITDIEIIYVSHKRKMDFLDIKSKKGKFNCIKSKISIPIIWFEKKDLKEFISILRKQKINRDIIIDVNL